MPERQVALFWLLRLVGGLLEGSQCALHLSHDLRLLFELRAELGRLVSARFSDISRGFSDASGFFRLLARVLGHQAQALALDALPLGEVTSILRRLPLLLVLA